MRQQECHFSTIFSVLSLSVVPPARFLARWTLVAHPFSCAIQQVSQCAGDEEASVIFHHLAIAHFRKTKVAFNNAEAIFNFGTRTLFATVFHMLFFG